MQVEKPTEHPGMSSSTTVVLDQDATKIMKVMEDALNLESFRATIRESVA